MDHADPEGLLRQIVSDDPAATGLLGQAMQIASSSRDRQLVAIAAAHLAGDRDRVEVLAREHLLDHPDGLLLTWMAETLSAKPTSPAIASHLANPHVHHLEKP